MAQSTDAQATFRRAFEEHYNAVSRYCLRRLSVQDAKDAAARTFVVAWRKIDAMPPAAETLPWLYRIAGYEVQTMRRSLRRQGALRTRLNGLGTTPELETETVVVRSAQHREVLDAIASLRKSDQEVILLRSYEDLGTNDLAAALGCSPDAAKQRLSRALKRLRRAMGITPDSPATTNATRAIEQGGDR